VEIDHSESVFAAQQNQWSECGRAASVGDADALGRPVRSIWSLGGSTMSQRKTWKIGLLEVFAVGIVAVFFVGPPSPAGCYELKLPPMPMMGGPVATADQLHINYCLSGGKVTVVSGNETADFGSYQRSASGWLMILGREDGGTVITNKVEANWFRLKITLIGSAHSDVLPRCYHFWK